MERNIVVVGSEGIEREQLKAILYELAWAANISHMVADECLSL